MPGETRTVLARYVSVTDVGPVALRLSGWNIETSNQSVHEEVRDSAASR